MSTRPPSDGGRVLLELRSHGPASVTYDVTLATADTTVAGVGAIDTASGTVELSGWDRTPPPWLASSAAAFLKTLWSARRRDPAESWPRRVHRWRAPRD